MSPKPASKVASLAAGLWLVAAAVAGSAAADGWRQEAIWDDGNAEFAAYEVTWARYAQTYPGRALLILVKEPWAPDLDVKADRPRSDGFDVLKVVVDEFIDRRDGDRLGLILFGTNAYTFVPLTFDLDTLRQLLSDISTGLAGRHTAIGDAIGLAVKSLREQDSEHKVLILVTDGSNTAGFQDPVVTALAARQQGLTVHTIGIGTVGSGLWMSYDSGANWRHIQKVLDGECNVRALAVSPHDPARILASSDREGLFESTDSGFHWQPAGGPDDRDQQFAEPIKMRFLPAHQHSPRPWPNRMLKCQYPDMKVSSTGYLSCHPTVA